MALSRTQIIILGASGILVLLVILIFTGIIPGLRTETGRGQFAGKITFWGVFDSSDVISQIIADYQKLQPKVEVSYRQMDPETYERDLINSLAGTGGPDVFMFHNTWLPKHFNKVSPLSSEQLSIGAFENLFPTVVEQDFAPDGIVFALPLYLDTLAMYYNKDYFDAKGIALPPKTWSELQNLVPRLRETDKSGRIQKSAAALGGSDLSINRATDILNLLLLQSGTKMVSDDFIQATFASDGLPSLNFYTQFANPASPYYTWNESLHYSLDNFAQGNTAVMFNYSHQVPVLKEKNPFLRFGISPMPQPSGTSQPVNFANYWGVAVSAKSNNYLAAGDFILYLTTNLEANKKYLSLNGRPPALRLLINDGLNDAELGVFNRQSLTARSWPQIDSAVVEEEFSRMISDVISGRAPAERAIKEAEDRITSLMQRRTR